MLAPTYRVSSEMFVLIAVESLAATPFAARGIEPMTLHLKLIVASWFVAFLLLICICCHTNHLHHNLVSWINQIQSLHQHYLILLHLLDLSL